MDPYNLIQEQLATINNNLNNSLAKIHDEVVTLSKRVESLENKTRDHENLFGNKLEDIEQTLLILPKIYNNQVSLIETQLVGHQYQFKRISNIITKDTETPPFANAAAVTNNNNNNSNILNSANGGISSQNRVNSPIPLNPQGRINQANRVNQQSQPTQINMPLARGQSQSNSIPSRRSTTAAATRTFINVPLDHDHNIGSLSNSVINPQRSQSTVGTTDTTNVLTNPEGTTTSTTSNNNNPQVDDDDDDDDGLIDEANFHKLNPNPKSVQEVLDEYYYGYQGQPSLKYLEESQKRWRKGNKNLSKTFSRRFRIVTAVEMGIQMYAAEMGGNEALAKERVINELENLRNRENGGRETMYWLFHHIPEHLKRKR